MSTPKVTEIIHASRTARVEEQRAKAAAVAYTVNLAVEANIVAGAQTLAYRIDAHRDAVARVRASLALKGDAPKVTR